MADQNLELEQIRKTYGERVALGGLSFSVGPGEIFGFVGANGAGKTTAMRIAMGVLAADSGQVRFGGQAVSFASRRSFGYMPEERGLYQKMTVAEQLQFFARLHGCSRAQAKHAMLDWTERLGIAQRRGDHLEKLSLGNQQRAQLAAAMVHDPAVLVLDEPFSGLDPVAVEVMSEVLRDKAADGVPVVFSSHQLELVERLCHRVGIVSEGSMIALGAVEELRGQAQRQLLVSGPDGQWWEELDGVRAAHHEGSHVMLELAADVDDQAVLQAAMRAGPVHEFAPQRPSLTELFREVVAG